MLQISSKKNIFFLIDRFHPLHHSFYRDHQGSRFFYLQRDIFLSSTTTVRWVFIFIHYFFHQNSDTIRGLFFLGYGFIHYSHQYGFVKFFVRAYDIFSTHYFFSQGLSNLRKPYFFYGYFLCIDIKSLFLNQGFYNLWSDVFLGKGLFIILIHIDLSSFMCLNPILTAWVSVSLTYPEDLYLP